MQEDKTNELVEMMFKVSRLMKEEMSYTNNLIHLSILQIQTLIFLSQNKKVSMGDIAGYFRIELSSATSLLNKLCDQGLVQRHEDKEDRRLVMITLTDKGKTLLKQAISHRRIKLEKMLSYLSQREKSELLNILKTLNNRLQRQDEK
ncbi:MarR family winged helix-turn-helix transcriptional regulator [Patescibacteria group bacterium]|nr:MarR family winged helix-turn-helix transcriptional regulator [Patescibacteria group bacterium]MCL5797329.1 MarR family winged helix-turn-helix transcriptional regulator [Patescibacteria group bacterium]